MSEKLDWIKAKDNLNFYINEYTNLGWTGMFGLLFLKQLKTRYDSGERTKELYDAMMEVQ